MSREHRDTVPHDGARRVGRRALLGHVVDVDVLGLLEEGAILKVGRLGVERDHGHQWLRVVHDVVLSFRVG